jgi:preprotein translocase subunit SecF
MRLFKDAHFDFLGARKRAYILSGILLLVGIVSMTFHKGFRYGVDFTGGTLFQLQFEQPTTVAELRTAVTGLGYAGSQIQRFGGTEEFLIRLPAFEETEDIPATLAASPDIGTFEVIRTEGVGPKVGSELRTRAAWAILLSFLLTLIYLAFRFEWRFGVAAIIATFHDMILTFGFISLFDIEITLATVAAILTIVGYSLNDTIVVFDRIRENLRRKRKESYVDTLNRSINETLPRTVLTSGTTLVTLLALFVLGGGVIRPFAFVLMLGVIIGTYSSIFVASPALAEIEQRRSARERARAH